MWRACSSSEHCWQDDSTIQTGPREVSSPTCCSKQVQLQDQGFIQLVHEKLQGWELHSLWVTFSTAWLLMVKKFSEYSTWASLVFIYAPCLSSSNHAPLWRAHLCLLDTLPVGASKLLVGPHPSSFSWVGRRSHSCLSAEIYFIIGEARGYWKIQLLMIFKATELWKSFPHFLKAVKMSEVELRRPLLLLTPCAWESKAALGLSWAPWSGSEENLQALFYSYLDFLLAEDLYIVHLLNVINSLPLLSPSCPHYTWYHDSDWLPRQQHFNPGGTGKGTSEYM